MLTSTQALMVKFGHIKLGKWQCSIYRPAKNFWKKSRDQDDKIIDQLNLSKSFPQCKFEVHIMSGSFQLVYSNQ